jgi:hypothetical protein
MIRAELAWVREPVDPGVCGLQASSMLRGNRPCCRQVPAQAYRNDVELPAGALLFGMPLVSFRREPRSRLYDSPMTNHLRLVDIFWGSSQLPITRVPGPRTETKMKHKGPEFRMQYRPLTDLEMKERERLFTPLKAKIWRSVKPILRMVGPDTLEMSIESHP